jgi:hypothetical protein
MNTDRNVLITVAVGLCLLLFVVAPRCAGQSEEKFYYWVAPGTEPNTPWSRERDREESFVVEVNESVAAKIESERAKGYVVGVEGTVVAGSVDYNRNYFLPYHPLWNWHLVDVINASLCCFPECECPDLVANPSEIARDIEQWNGHKYRPRFYIVNGRIDPNRDNSLANVSNRGLTGAGEKALITGFIIKGGEPRNVIVRAIGPSLAAQGVQQPALNPKIEVYRGNVLVAANDDWKTDHRAKTLGEAYAPLAPTHEKESALLLTLLPGAYTLHGLNAAAAEGVVLLEAYDVDSNSE